MSQSKVLVFNEIDKNKLNLVGGKAANLGEMTRFGIPVPNGFCISTDVYKEFMELNSLSGVISDIVKDANIENITHVGEEIRKRIIQSEVPAYLDNEIECALNNFSEDEYFSIRSSATAEDLTFVSFAGQQDTYLNIKGKEEIINHIRKCWASLYSDRAILYRIQNNINHDIVWMSVVVQKMVFSEVSGIMFTADPVTGNRNILSIDASFGLGEAVVSGLVTPDIYKINKPKMLIVDKIISSKKIAIMPLAAGGTETLELSEEKSNTQTLDDETILKLAELAMRIENHYGAPQDIEWCYEKEQLYIVQSRAITSLFPIPLPKPNDGKNRVYVCLNHLQSMTDTMSPLGLDLFRYIIRAKDVPLNEYRPQIVATSAGRMYCDFTGIMNTNFGRKKMPDLMDNADVLISQSIKALIERGEFNQKSKLKVSVILKFLNLLKSLPLKVFYLLFIKDPKKIVGIADRFVVDISERAKKNIRLAEPGASRLEEIYKEVKLLDVFGKTVMPYLFTGIMSMKMLEKISLKTFGNTDYINQISKGLEGNVTTNMGLLIGDLTDIVRKSPSLIEEFKSEDFNSLYDRIANLSGHENFKELFNQFINKYGCRANGEIDIASDRWAENPEQLARSIISMVETLTEGQHREEFKDTVEAAQEKCNEFVEAVEKQRGKLMGVVVRRLVKVLRNALPIREHHKFMLMNIFLTSKTSILSDSKYLVSKGLLETEEDVFYLEYLELYSAYIDGTNLKQTVEQRKELYSYYKRMTPPRVITSEGEIVTANYDFKNYPPNALVGIAVSGGVIEGIARVITDPKKQSINKGEILVASFTDPSWTPLFINAAGLVMEVGGMLTHGTVVAREYGLPAVVGVDEVTKKIKSGDRVRVDGNAGYVIIINHEV